MVNNLLAGLLDAGSFRRWDDGSPESVITGAGTIGARPVAVVASDFGFRGGSIGLVAGERLARAVERATGERRPLIALPASGGTRMQEGTAAFLQMLKVTAAVTRHKAAGLPYVVYLRHPVTGGVLASWASLGHLTLAEPGALIGFLGPRVGEALTGRPFPAGVQVAEHLHAHGLIDAVVPPADLPARLAAVLQALAPVLPSQRDPGMPGPAANGGEAGGRGARDRGDGRDGQGRRQEAGAWEAVCRTRGRDYPRGAGLVAAAARDVAMVAAAGGLSLAVGRIPGRAASLAEAGQVVLAWQAHDAPLGVAGLRLARRGIELAGGLGLPLVTVIDTPGAELSVAAEEAGIAGQVARCLEDMITLDSPTVAVLLGQGTGGGALALLAADRVIAAGHAWLAPLAPEGASAIVHRDTAHAADLARAQGIRAADLAAAGLVDRVVSTADPAELSAALAAALRDALAGLLPLDAATRAAARHARFRALGC
ncbi:MAG TPA: carboxyl transferase domain-containing protein [Trebonia sp.]|nr:carboxyl transferase domain-containing protein [Trebonia sp.]